MTVRDFTLRMWYGQEISICPRNHLNKMLFEGTNQALRSDLYKGIKDMEVSSFGADEDKIIIEVVE